MDKKTAYHYNKYIAHIDKIKACANNELFPPVFAIVYPTAICNDSCGVIHCPYKRKEGYLFEHVNQNGFIPKDILLSLPKQLKDSGVLGLEVSGGGEPLLSPYIKEFFQNALDEGLDIGLVSNGSRFHDDILPLLSKFKWVRVSLNGGNEKDFNDVHNPKNSKGNLSFDGRLKQLEKLNKIKSPETLIGYSFVIGRIFELTEDNKMITKTNAGSIYDAAKIAKDIGCDNIRFSLAFTPDHTEKFDDIWEDAKEQILRAKRELEDENFTVFAMSLDRMNDKVVNSSGIKPFDTCNYSKFTTIINSDANISDCCVTSYLPNHILGSLKEKSFKDIWFSQDRLNHQNNINVNGKSCSNCFMIQKNVNIQYLLDVENKNAMHLNFP